MAISIPTLLLSKQYTDNSIAGGGISAGKNCVINSITEISTGHRVEFQWTLDNGTVQTATMDVADAVQIAGITADAQNRIIVEMADGTVYTTATIPTVPGYSPSAVAERVDAGAKITITDKTGTTTAIAEDGVSPEVSVVRNPQDTGVIITITDAEGEHTATVNDGSVSATMPYANVTGKPQINSVELNGNKSLADLGINIPTRNSQLLNDSNFITASDLPTIDTALSAVSSNPVTNSAITTEIRATQGTLNDTIVDVGANTDAITVLNGNATVNGSVQKQIQDALANLDRLTKQIVAELPPVSSAVENVIYLIPNQSGTAYEQWTIVDDGQGGKVYAQLGSTDTDLSGYYTSAQVDSLLGDKQATLTGAATSVASLNLSTNRAVVSDANGKIAASSITATELEALDDVTGNIQDQINGKEDALTWDSAPTNASTNPVTSGGVYTALQAKQDTLTFDSVPTALSNNPVTSAGIKTAIDAKQDTFQVEELPIASSTYEDVILQYIGAETGGLVNGAFYKCELNSSTATYEWNEFVPFAVPEKTSDLINDSDFVSDDEYVHTDNNYDDTAKAAVDALGTASTKDFTDRVRPGSHDLVEAGSVYSAITEAVSSIYTPHGSITCAELIPALLISDNVGNTYNVTDSGVTTEYYINGAGKTIHVGDTVGIINAGPDTIMFNLMGAIIDLTDYQEKELATPLYIGGVNQTTVEGALGALTTAKAEKSEMTITARTGAYAGYSDVQLRQGVSGTFVTDISAKADKASSATAGDIATLDANGNLTDSGIASAIIPSDASASNKLVDDKRFSGARSNVDCNTLTTAGVYSTAGANVPESGFWFMVVVQHGYINATEYIMQLAYSVADTSKTYRRVSSDGGSTWSVWNRIITQSDLTSSVTSGSNAPVTSGGVANYIRTSHVGANNTDTLTITLPTFSEGDAYEIIVTAQWWAGAGGFSAHLICSMSGGVYALRELSSTGAYTKSVSNNVVTISTTDTNAYMRAMYTKI